jgi:3D (Asp-Asp-Asp) domain-containing protein
MNKALKGILIYIVIFLAAIALYANHMFCIDTMILIELEKSSNDILQAELLVLKKEISDLSKQNKSYQEQIDELTQGLNEYRRIVDEQNETLFELQDKTDFLSRGEEQRPIKQTMYVTAYWEGSCGKAPDDPLYGITASGERVKEWYTIAAGPELPMGTVVYIPYFKDKPNGGYFVVKDRGGAIDNGDLDIYMTSAEECFKHGVKYLDVYIIGKESDIAV